MSSDRLRRVIRKYSGVSLDESREYLLKNRLGPLLKERGFGGLDDLALRLEKNRDRRLLEEVIDAITTNETRFFRDEPVFERIYREIMPRLAERPGPIRIWSAGCSTGQEPYSLAMGLCEQWPDLPVHIDACDISEAALERSRAGEYTEFETGRGLPAGYRSRYFEAVGKKFRVQERLRQKISFEQLNLIHPFEKGPYDMIMFRNVAIYFEEDVRRRVFEFMYRSLRSDGFLVVGTAETPIQYLPDLRIHQFGSVRYYSRES